MLKQSIVCLTPIGVSCLQRTFISILINRCKVWCLIFIGTRLFFRNCLILSILLIVDIVPYNDSTWLHTLLPCNHPCRMHNFTILRHCRVTSIIRNIAFSSIINLWSEKVRWNRSISFWLLSSCLNRSLRICFSSGQKRRFGPFNRLNYRANMSSSTLFLNLCSKWFPIWKSVFFSVFDS